MRINDGPYVIKSGEMYYTIDGGYSKNIDKAHVFAKKPDGLCGKERVVAIKILREEVGV